MKKFAACAAAVLCLATGSSQAEGIRLRPFVGVGATAGGDNLAAFQYTGSNSETLKAGGKLDIKTGLDISFNPIVSGQFSLGYHTASSSNLSFSRIPLELLGHARVAESFRIGGGLRTTLHGRMTGTGTLAKTNQSFSNSYGMVLEGDYFVTNGLALTLRYVVEKYKYNGSGESISGNHLGAFLNYYFN